MTRWRLKASAVVVGEAGRAVGGGDVSEAGEQKSVRASMSDSQRITSPVAERLLVEHASVRAREVEVDGRSRLARCWVILRP